jgi:predicted PurR-regulated permease PerM
MADTPEFKRWLPHLVAAAIGAWLLYLLTPILAPFLTAAALAYLCDPLVDRLQGRRVNRTLATLLVLSGLLALFVLLVLILAPLLQAQVRLLMQQLPRLVEWGTGTMLPWLSTRFDIDLQRDQAQILDWLKAHAGELSGLARHLPALTDGGLAVLAFLANLVLVPVVLFYLLRDWKDVLTRAAGWIPAALRRRTLAVAREIDAVLAQFVRGQIMVIAVMSLFYSIGLWLVGLDYALAVGLISGILVFVPYLGAIVGVLLGTLAAWTQFGDFTGLMLVWAVFAVGQTLESLWITPWLVGDRVGLHPVAVIFALMAFGQLFGFVGVLLAIPAAAATLVALRHLRAQLA